MCLRGMLWGILCHHVPGKVVLHRHHHMHLNRICNVFLCLGSVKLVFELLISLVLRRHCDVLVSIQIWLVDELIMSEVLLFLQNPL